MPFQCRFGERPLLSHNNYTNRHNNNIFSMLYIHHHSPYHEVQGVVLMLILDGPPRAVQITSLCRRLVVLKVGWH